MKSADVRKAFVEYFKKHGHTAVASSPLVPQGDATLLFANAGMNQFKNLFLGLESRDYKRAVSVQKCVRAGGKHNDLENVGHTARHHTFFEMLGNFSFGDYFKKEAIHHAWDLLTNVLKIDKNRLYVTVHISDDEAAGIWEKQEGVPANRIFRFDEDNFWRMGDTGPCGPCSEIFFDHAPDGKIPTQKEFAAQSDRFVEIWNLVFMQYNEDGAGRHPLPKPSVDTGSGLERLTAVMQGVSNNYDTDLFRGLINAASAHLNLNYDRLREDNSESAKDQLVALRVLADHSRATSFLIADGVIPSNEGRGYVLRRIMRRAIRYGRKLTDQPELFTGFCSQVIATMSDAYPELQKQKSFILGTVSDEIQRFLKTLDQGTQILNEELKKLRAKNQKTVSGEAVFRLYDTYGFPVDLTRLMAAEEGFSVDESDFEKHMEQAREKARASWKGQALSADAAHLIQIANETPYTEFSGYERTEDSGKILLLSSGKDKVSEIAEGGTGIVVTDRSCFYGESGGQVGDHGRLETETGKAEVVDCTKVNGVHFHHVRVTSGRLLPKQGAQLAVTDSARRQTAANHSATHLLHSALREILGEQVTQAGSLVEPSRLRFDFTHNKALTAEEVGKIEDWVNHEISLGYDSRVVLTDPKTAVEKEGALALFGEKYGDEVRVIKMGPNSTELCGGTHVKNTAMIRLFKIVAETGVSSGIRRIEALTGDAALQFLQKHAAENLAAREAAGIHVPWHKFAEDSRQVRDAIEALHSEIKELKKVVVQLKSGQIDVDDLIRRGKTVTVGGENAVLVTAYLEVDDRKMLSDITDKIKNKLPSGAAIIVGRSDGSYPLIVAVTKSLSEKLKAGQIVKTMTEVAGGKGGGRPDFAQGTIDNPAKLKEAFDQVARSLTGH